MDVYQNRWNNSELTGATVGVIGAGGVAPTGWSLPVTGGGVTITNEITSLTTTAGQYIVGFKQTCVNASGGQTYPTNYLGAVAVSASTLYRFAVWSRIVSLTGSTFFAWYGYTTNVGGNVTNVFSPSGTWARGTNSLTTAVGVNTVNPYFGLGNNNGESYTIEIEIAQGMIEPGATLTSYIPTINSTPVSAAVQPFRGHNRAYLEL